MDKGSSGARFGAPFYIISSSTCFFNTTELKHFLLNCQLNSLNLESTSFCLVMQRANVVVFTIGR